MKIAVTGGTGQIGTVLIRMLLEQGHEVSALLRSWEGGLKNLPIRKVQGDTTDPASLDTLLEGNEIVMHLAAIVSITGDQGGLVRKTNFEGTCNVVEACLKNKIRKLIHFSSVHAYDSYPHDTPMDETRPLVGPDGYAYDRSKSDAQAYVQKAVKERGLDAVIINPTAVLGPYDYRPSIKGQLMIDFYKGKIPVLTPGGYDWVDSRDVCDAAIRAIEHGKTGESYLCSGQYYTIRDFAALIGKVIDRKMPTLVMPFGVLKAAVPFVEAWARLSGKQPLYTRESIDALMEGNPHVSHAKAARDLGYHPRPLEETLRDTYAWLKAEGMLK